jgi:hypothetical protein
MRRSDTPSASRRELLIFALPALVLIAAAFALAWQFVRPAPPKKIVISTGARRAYHYFGERYRDKLAQDGIEVELRPSSGAVENLRRLKTDDSVDVGFMQGGIANEPDPTTWPPSAACTSSPCGSSTGPTPASTASTS